MKKKKKKKKKTLHYGGTAPQTEIGMFCALSQTYQQHLFLKKDKIIMK